jgi:hypothetical protein
MKGVFTVKEGRLPPQALDVADILKLLNLSET